ncbi:MAG: cellulase family glycosylhydrolase [Anaerolineae bacterium]|nr:cellulase family glycosylhydrolase [Anaerolineae bacterium]
MRHNNNFIVRFWPWLLIVLVMFLGLAIASCGSGAARATPTPTKTPRPAVEQHTAAPQPTVTVPVPPSATTNPAPATRPLAATATVPPTAARPTATAVPPTATAKPAAPAPAPAGQMSSPDYGVQAFLWWRPEVADRDLNLVKDAGFTWVKQLFSWQDIEGAGKGHFDWERPDRIVEDVNKRGLKLIVRISMDPDRPFWAGNPPDNAQHFADFAGQVAARYRGRIHAYQVWNEPNLAREWGGKRPDPAGYVRLLRLTYAAIKAADPNAIVVTAGMAPTTEDSNRAMPDMRFYQGMYDAMGRSDGYFDMLGVHGAGYAAAPETDPQVVATTPKLHNNDPSPAELKRVYSFRHIEDVRSLMVRNGDANKRVVVLEFGWTTDNRPDSPYYWHGAGAGIDEGKQGCYIVRAYKYARENWQPWIGLMSVIYLPDVNWTKNDEQYYWSIIGPGYPDLYLRFAYGMLKNYLNKGIIEDFCAHFQ